MRTPTSSEADLLSECEALRARLAERERECESLRARLADRAAAESSATRQRGLSERPVRLLATALEAVREGVAITDVELEAPGPRLLFVNDYFSEMSGYRPEELAGEPVLRLCTLETRDEVLERLGSALASGDPFHGELVQERKGGGEYVVSCHASPVTGPDGELTNLVFIQRDVTDRKRADEALRRSEERYRLLIERMSEGFATTDRDNRIDLVNAKFVDLLGYSRDELRGRYLGDLVDAENRRRLEAEEERRRRGKAEPYELQWTAKDGRQIDTVISPTSLQDAEGRFIGSFAVVTDVTERKRSEQERRRLETRIQKAQKMESLGLLAGGVAHDFNNLLVGMLGHAGLALMELSPESPARPLVRQIETAALRASELTREMLAYSGKGKLVIEAIAVSDLVEEMAHLLRVSISKKATLQLDFAEGLPPIEGDPTQIRQVVMNLITNASEAIGESSGTISIRTGRMEVDRAYLASTYLDEELATGSYVFLEVSDTGSGMDAATRAKIFDPFFTTKFTGRGLGLAAVLGIVRGHQGAIKVYSEPGRGTSFKVLFPASSGAVVEAEESGSGILSFRGEGCVLVVDDEEMVRGVAEMSLEMVGFEVLSARDGVEALEVFEREGERIDAVVLDMTMPRMGGEETYRELRRRRPDLKIILSSGFNEQETTARFVGKGLDGFLQKPFQPKQLIAKVRELLAS